MAADMVASRHGSVSSTPAHYHRPSLPGMWEDEEGEGAEGAKAQEALAVGSASTQGSSSTAPAATAILSPFRAVMQKEAASALAASPASRPLSRAASGTLPKTAASLPWPPPDAIGRAYRSTTPVGSGSARVSTTGIHLSSNLHHVPGSPDDDDQGLVAGDALLMIDGAGAGAGAGGAGSGGKSPKRPASPSNAAAVSSPVGGGRAGVGAPSKSIDGPTVPDLGKQTADSQEPDAKASSSKELGADGDVPEAKPGAEDGSGVSGGAEALRKGWSWKRARTGIAGSFRAFRARMRRRGTLHARNARFVDRHVPLWEQLVTVVLVAIFTQVGHVVGWLV